MMENFIQIGINKKKSSQCKFVLFLKEIQKNTIQVVLKIPMKLIMIVRKILKNLKTYLERRINIQTVIQMMINQTYLKIQELNIKKNMIYH